MAASLLLLVVTVASLSAPSISYVQERDPRFLDAFFYPSRDPVDVRESRGTLQDTMDQLTSSVSTAIDRLAETIEGQVEASLPHRLRHYGSTQETEFGGGLEGLEAISGILGEGVDDGLRTHFNGDLDGVRVDEPRFEEPNEQNKEEGVIYDDDDDDDDEDEEVDGPSSTVPYQPLFPLDNFNPFSNPLWRPGTGLFNFMNRRPAWWKGPNVCVEREEIDEGKDLDSSISEGEDTSSSSSASASSRGLGSTLVFTVGNMQVTSCTETNDKYTCTSRISRRGIHKTVIVTHKCCHGYVREGNSCSRVELRSMQKTLEDIGSEDFLTLAKMADMMDVMEQNITLFVPTNEAMEEFMADLEVENGLGGNGGDGDGDDGDRSDNEVYPMVRGPLQEKPMAMSHATQGIMYASDLTDEQVLPSLMEGATLRINTYNTVPPAATVNCARMVSINKHSTHGVVHTIDKVLLPVTRNLADLISSDPRFSILYRLIEKAGLVAKLREAGQLTVFAPSDAAFHTLPPQALEALLTDNACVDAIVKNHILPNVICTAAVQGKARTLNLLEEFVLVERTEDDDIYVEERVKVVTRDVMGTNGVLHVVDRPIMPDAAKNVLDVIKSHNLTRFLGLLESANMIDEVSNMKEVTIFAPSNRAIEIIPKDEYDALVGDKDKLRSLLKYHITTSALQASDITNNHMADTQAHLPLRINLYSRSPVLAGLAPESGGGNPYVRMTAGCSRVSTLDSRACGAVVHVVERILSPPKESVIHYLEADEDFSLFTKMIHNTGMSETLSREGPFTVLAPSDHVFQSLPQMEYQNVMDDVELQEKLVKQHVIKEHVCCAGINPNTWLFMDRKRPLEGVPVHLRRSMSGRIMAGNARITYCAPPSGNGLVHTVNHLLLDVNPDRRRIDRTRTPLFSMPALELFFG